MIGDSDTPPSAPPPASRDDAERREAEDILNSLLLYRHADGVDQARRFFSSDAKRLADVLRARDASLATANVELDAARAEIATLRDDPEMDATDDAHPAWWRGHDHTAAVFCKLANEILDGKEVAGVSGEPWEALRQRLARLRSAAPSGESKEATHRRFYEAFHAWLSAEDEWDGVDMDEAPEALATIAVEIHDAVRVAPSGNLRAEIERLRSRLNTIAKRANYPAHKATDTSFLRATAIICREQAEQALASPQPDATCQQGQPCDDPKKCPDPIGCGQQPDVGAGCEGGRCEDCPTWDDCSARGCLRERVHAALSPSPEAAPPSADDVAR